MSGLGWISYDPLITPIIGVADADQEPRPKCTVIPSSDRRRGDLAPKIVVTLTQRVCTGAPDNPRRRKVRGCPLALH